jgi:hypothetical protein
MTLSSGCGNKTLVRLGEGNLKSLVVLMVMSLAASLMLFTSFDYWLFLQWMTPLGIDFSDYGIPSQDINAVITGMAGSETTPTSGLLVALIIGLGILVWVLRERDFRANLELLIAGLVIGALVITAWYITAGSGGQELLEELEFMDERPYAAGAQSISFIAPAGHAAQYIYQGFSFTFLSFGVVTVLGVIVGSFLYTLLFRRIRIEWFVTRNDFLLHIVRCNFNGYRWGAGNGLYHWPGHFRGIDPGPGIYRHHSRDNRRQRDDDEIPVLPDDA